MATTAKKFTLMWHTSTPAGWRYLPVILERRDDVMEPKKHGWVIDKGKLVEYPKGRYVLRSYIEGRKVYTPIPSVNPRDAGLTLGRAIRHAKAAGVTRNPLTLIKTAKDAYIRDCEQRGAKEAAIQARAVLNEFLSLPLCRDILQVRSVTRDHVFAFHRALRSRGLSDRTVANKHERLRSWLKFCGADTKFLPPVPKYENKLPTVYTPAEIKALRAGADTYMRLAIDMALKLGLRDRELVFAMWSDVDFHHATFRVTGKPSLGFTVKDSEQRDIPIPDDLLVNLTERRKVSSKGDLILGNKQGKPENHFLRKLQQVAKRVEVADATLHKLRRNYLTTLLRNGLDLKTVQHYAGHSDLASTMRYLRPASTSETQDRINAIVWE